mmetsp:Transcript_21781/g.37391  ORF Transcript_21781/g.37391 Transcript_21781/m.37391 type:complete len:550 (+) Transcript_21781:72-1721(+)
MGRRIRSSAHRAAGSNSDDDNSHINQTFAHRNFQDISDAINHHWANLPDGAKNLLADSNRDVDFLQLVDYWSTQALTLSREPIMSTMCASSWYMALNYLRLGKLCAARNLMLNGGFVQEAYFTPIKEIIATANHRLRNSDNLEARLQFIREKFPRYHSSYAAAWRLDTMEAFLKKAVPPCYQRMMNFASKTAHGPVKEYVNLISNDWQDNSRLSNTNSSCNDRQGKESETICIIMTDEVTKEEVKLEIGSSTTLKSLFNDYAQVRGTSLRSLRFLFEGRTLFLSSAKNKTAEQLGLGNLAIIKVTDLTGTSNEKVEDGSSLRVSTASSNKKSSKGSFQNKKGKKSKKRNVSSLQPRAVGKTEEELKIEHSKILTKLHEEAEQQFRQTRQRLNNLLIQRTQPKLKSLRPKFVPPLPETHNYFPRSTGYGGKAGKSRYVVQVGEVQNLHKTSKPRHGTQAAATLPQSFSIDLHGLTKAEAIDLLNEKLPQWNDIAMSGSYPFVSPVEIICGCGNQILSETVEKWIKRNDKVSNAPKNLWVPQRNSPYPYAA